MTVYESTILGRWYWRCDTCGTATGSFATKEEAQADYDNRHECGDIE